MERDFKGIWIPKEIWLSQDLTLQEKAFLTEIDSLDNKDGCFASNDYFAGFFQLSKNRCSEVIKSLEKKGIIQVKYIRSKGKNNIEKRVIKVLGISNRGIRNVDLPIRNIEEGYSGNCEDNNTLVNNTSNNTNIKKKKSSDIDILIQNYTANEKLIETIQDFLKMRKSIKKPMTSRAMELLLKKLDTLSTDNDTKIDILNQSIFNSWQGIFPLKEGIQDGRKEQPNNSSNTEDKIEYDFSKYGA